MPPTAALASAHTNALLYCTFNGAANCTNGIGRQTQTLLGALSRRWDELTAITGSFTPYLAIPTPGPATWAYDPARLTDTQKVIEARGGHVFTLSHDLNAPLWSPTAWRQLSDQAIDAAYALATRYDRVALMAIDTPFAGTGNAHLARRPQGFAERVHILLTLYGTAYLHGHPEHDPDRLAWEQQALTAARQRDVHIADIGKAFTRHLTAAFGVDPAKLIPCRSSLDLTAPDLQPMPPAEASQVTSAYGVPLDRPLILAVGRTDHTKGLDRLISALIPLRDLIHLVAVVVPFDDNDPLTRSYQRHIAAAGLRSTYISRFTRDLPRALASLPHTLAVACPSRGEALANLPLEVGLWARDGGPVVVAPDSDGFPETITHLRNGILYDPRSPGGLTNAIRQAMALDDASRRALCQEAHRRVACERDVVPAYGDTLTRLFTAATSTTG